MNLFKWRRCFFQKRVEGSEKEEEFFFFLKARFFFYFECTYVQVCISLYSKFKLFSFSEFMQELLTFVLILSISSTCLCRGLVEDTSGGFNVLDYGAVGDGQTDDSQVYELVSQHFIYFFVFAFYFLIYAFKELKGEEGILVSLL